LILYVFGAVQKHQHHAAESPGIDSFERGQNPTALDEEILADCKSNILGNIHLFNLFLPLLLKGEQKKVIFISSGLADLDLTSKYEIEVSGPYSLAKAAMNLVVAKFHAEYAKDGVLFMSISPGLVDTGHFDLSICRLYIPSPCHNLLRLHFIGTKIRLT
jgi:NAD(P)-dependent dehydrogenase (short-subunit alcohol dehydrogenase family)